MFLLAEGMAAAPIRNPPGMNCNGLIHF